MAMAMLRQPRELTADAEPVAQSNLPEAFAAHMQKLLCRDVLTVSKQRALVLCAPRRTWVVRKEG
jgi:hypothetical protein